MENMTVKKENFRKTTNKLLTISLIFSIILLFGLSSCTSESDKLKVSQIEVISSRLEAVVTLYSEIDINKVDTSYKTLLFNIYEINSLKINPEDKLIFDYGILKKGFKEFIKSHDITLKELENCRNQINTLKEDVSNGLLSDEEFELYLKHEGNASQSLRVRMTYYHNRISSIMEKFDSLNPQVEIIIDSVSLTK